MKSTFPQLLQPTAKDVPAQTYSSSFKQSVENLTAALLTSSSRILQISIPLILHIAFTLSLQHLHSHLLSIPFALTQQRSTPDAFHVIIILESLVIQTLLLTLSAQISLHAIARDSNSSYNLTKLTENYSLVVHQ